MSKYRSPLPWTTVFNRCRLVVIASVFLLSVTRALGYSPLVAGHVSIGPSVISGHGAYIGLWVTLWAAVAVVAVIDLFTKRQDSITALSFMMAAWGASYLVAWIISGFEEMGWLTMITYWAPAAMVIALSKMVQILGRVIRG